MQEATVSIATRMYLLSQLVQFQLIKLNMPFEGWILRTVNWRQLKLCWC